MGSPEELRNNGPMDEFRLHDSTGHWIARVFVAMRREFDKSLKSERVSIGEWAVLAAVFPGEATTPSAIAEFTDVDRAAVTRLLDKLTDEKGYTTRELSSSDRRSFTVSLTRRGKRVAARLFKENERINKQFLKGISSHEAKELRRLLHLMCENASTNS